jgi:hypothetical protein
MSKAGSDDNQNNNNSQVRQITRRAGLGIWRTKESRTRRGIDRCATLMIDRPLAHSSLKKTDEIDPTA